MNLTMISSHLESLFILVKNQVHHFGLVYRPPSSRLPVFLRDFDELILSHVPSENTTICGDFNIDLMSPTSPQGLDYIELMNNKGFSELITLPTRIVSTQRGRTLTTSKTLIDHWSSNRTDMLSYVVESSIADHSPICTIYHIRNVNDKKIVESRTFKRSQWSHFHEEFDG